MSTANPAREFTLPATIAKSKPKVGLILGSGLGSFVDRVKSSAPVSYGDIAGLPVSRVPGHSGTLHCGKISGIEVAVAKGRVHCYEGWSAREATALVRLFREMGVRVVILTNAAGIVNANFKPGRWMLLSDHINFARLSPLTGSASFIDQSEVYSRPLRCLIREVALELGLPAPSEGVYAWMNGPEYETPAEIKMLRALGADAVGMSTVPEAIQARALGLEVVALSCLTNYGAGLSGKTLSHAEVMEVGAKAAGQLVDLLEKCIPQMV
jgi:purine-nucleoside phosphorylase